MKFQFGMNPPKVCEGLRVVIAWLAPQCRSLASVAATHAAYLQTMLFHVHSILAGPPLLLAHLQLSCMFRSQGLMLSRLPETFHSHFLCSEPISISPIPASTRFSTLINHLSSIPIHFFLGAVSSCPFACCSSAFHPRRHPPDSFQPSILPPSRPPSTPPPHLASSKAPSWLPPSFADCPTPASSTRSFRLHLESPPCSYIYTTLVLHLLSS